MKNKKSKVQSKEKDKMYLDVQMTYKKARENETFLKKLGMSKVILGEGPYPWHLVHKLGVIGSRQGDPRETVMFYAEDSSNGLTYKWFFDIIVFGATGFEQPTIKVEAIKKILGSLKGKMQKKFKDHLLLCADGVAESNETYVKIVKQHKEEIKALRALGNC